MTTKPYHVKNATVFWFIMIFPLFLALLGICFIIFYFFPAIAGIEGNTITPAFGVFFPVVFLTGVGIFLFCIRMMEIRAVPRQRFTGKQNTIKQVTALNSNSIPFEIIKHPKYDLMLKFKLADAKWKGVLFRGGLRKGYWLYLKLDESKRIAYFCEKSIELGSSMNIGGISSKMSVFYGLNILDTRRMKVYDTLQAFKKVADIKYNVGDARWPVFDVLLRNGWTIKPKMFPFMVRK